MAALRRYIVFRVKAMEFLDTVALWKCLRDGTLRPVTPFPRAPGDFADSLRAGLLSSLAAFVDKSKRSMNVIKLWKELFPSRVAEIDRAWERLEPGWGVLRRFRNQVGFHADQPRDFFATRREVLGDERLQVALEEFQRLLGSILRSEPEDLPDLATALDCLLEEMSSAGGQGYDPSEVRRYLMIR